MASRLQFNTTSAVPTGFERGLRMQQLGDQARAGAVLDKAVADTMAGANTPAAQIPTPPPIASAPTQQQQPDVAPPQFYDDAPSPPKLPAAGPSPAGPSAPNPVMPSAASIAGPARPLSSADVYDQVTNRLAASGIPGTGRMALQTMASANAARAAEAKQRDIWEKNAMLALGKGQMDAYQYYAGKAGIQLPDNVTGGDANTRGLVTRAALLAKQFYGRNPAAAERFVTAFIQTNGDYVKSMRAASAAGGAGHGGPAANGRWTPIPIMQADRQIIGLLNSKTGEVKIPSMPSVPGADAGQPPAPGGAPAPAPTGAPPAAPNGAAATPPAPAATPAPAAPILGVPRAGRQNNTEAAVRQRADIYARSIANTGRTGDRRSELYWKAFGDYMEKFGFPRDPVKIGPGITPPIPSAPPAGNPASGGRPGAGPLPAIATPPAPAITPPAAPGPTPAPPVPSAPPQAPVPAAVAPPAANAPQRAVNPKTGQTIILEGGRWIDEKTRQPVQ